MQKIIGIGPRIRQWRKKAGMKSFELAEKLNVSQSALSEVENDKTNPSTGTIVAFIKYTDINIHWMLTGVELAIDDGGISEEAKVTIDVLPEQEISISSILKIRVLAGEQVLLKGME